MAAPYKTGTVTLTNGSAVVTGAGTAWQTALIIGGVLYPEADGNPLPILSIDSNTQLTAATVWKGASGDYAYAIMRDDVVKQQIVATSNALANLIQQLGSPALAAVAGLQPAQDRLPYFAGANAGALATLTAFGRAMISAAAAADVRALIGANDAANLNAGTMSAARLPYNLGVRYFDYQINGGDVVIENDDNRSVFFRKKAGAVVQARAYHNQSQRAFIIDMWNDQGAYLRGFVLKEDGTMFFGDQKVITHQAEYLEIGTSVNYNKMLVKNHGDFHGAGIVFRPFVDNANHLYFQRVDGTLVGSVYSTANGTSYNTASDHRLKYDVEALVDFAISAEEFDGLDNALLRVLAMRPVSFRFYKDPETQTKDADAPIHHGFIAHELQQPMPHAVTGTKDGMMPIGRAVKPAKVIPEEVIPGALVSPAMPEVLNEAGDIIMPAQPAVYDEDTVIPGRTEPEQVIDNIPEASTPEGYTWEKTGERIDPQVVDHSKLVADLTAAVQSLTRVVLDQKADIAALTARVAQLEEV